MPLAYVNEVLPVNLSVHSDEQGEFDPWIELYNAFLDPIDLSGLYLTDDWPFRTSGRSRPGPRLCGTAGCSSGRTARPGEGPLHANFVLNPAAAQSGCYDKTGFLVDSLTYPALRRQRLLRQVSRRRLQPE